MYSGFGYGIIIGANLVSSRMSESARILPVIRLGSWEVVTTDVEAALLFQTLGASYWCCSKYVPLSCGKS